MTLSTLTQTVFSDPYGIDQTARRWSISGKFVFSASPGTYASGGLLPNLGLVTASVLAPLQDSTNQNVELATYTQPATAKITNISVTSDVVTVYTSTPPAVGQFVTFNGLTTLPALNGLTLQVQSVSAGVSFTVDFTTANLSETAETGQAVTVIGPDSMEIHSIAGSGYIYQYNKAKATVQIFVTGTASGDPLNELAAGSTPAGVSGDVVHFVATWARA